MVRALMQLPLKDTLRPDEHDLFIIIIFLYLSLFFMFTLFNLLRLPF